jgi:hypothetical protein
MKGLRVALIHERLGSAGEVEICSVEDSTLAYAILSICIDRLERTAEADADEGDTKQLRIMQLIKEQVYRERSKSGSPPAS